MSHIEVVITKLAEIGKTSENTEFFNARLSISSEIHFRQEKRVVVWVRPLVLLRQAGVAVGLNILEEPSQLPFTEIRTGSLA